MYRSKASPSTTQRPTVVRSSSCEICRVYGSPSSRTPSTDKDIQKIYGRNCNCGDNYRRQGVGLGE